MRPWFLLPWLTALLVGTCAGPAAAAPLPAGQVGTPLHAPALSGAVAHYAWARCRRYEQLVRADAPAALWPLGDAGERASELIAGADGHAQGQVSAVGGALVGEAAQATRFGDTAALVAPHMAALDATGAYTLELWVRPRVVDGRVHSLVGQQATVDGRTTGTGLTLSSAGLSFERFSDGVRTAVTSAAGLAPGAWSQVTASYDGTVMRLFVDGRQVGSRTAPSAAPGGSAPLEIGGRFDGDVDEVALYPRALARGHVAAHSAAGGVTPCTTLTAAVASSYTPVAADVGSTLRATTTGVEPTESETAETPGPVTDAGATVGVTLLTPAAGTTATGVVQVTAELAGLPADRVEFLIDGTVRYAKVAEPAYQYTWYTRAEANGPHTVGVRVYGPQSTTAVTAQRTVTVANATQFPAPLAFGRESMYAEFNEGDEATANNLLDDVWPARGFALPKLGWPLTWTEDPYHDAYWRFYHYSLRPESSLLFEWRTTHDRRYLNKLIAILRSFVAYDAVRPANTLTFDNNHAAAYRTMTLINFYAKLRADGELPADLELGLRGALQRLGGFLSDPAHFEGAANHGFNEGAALLLLAENFPTLTGAPAWRATAVQRLNAMLVNTLDADGVEVENSPFYHVYVLGLVYQIAEWAKRYEPALAAPYGRAEAQMLRYAAYVTQPNGYLPMLGATATTYLPSQDPTVYGTMVSDPEFQFAYTRGKAGLAPPDGASLFPAAGLFILRSPLSTAANLAKQTFTTFDAGPYRTEHSDLDALSLTLYTGDGVVLPDAGLFTYTDQPDRGYFHGTRAHNTVVVDGADQQAGTATAGLHGSSGGSSWASGTSGLYAGVTHRRTVVTLRQGLDLVVDRLDGAAAHTYTQTWHLAPDAEIEVRGSDVAVSNAAGKRTLTIRQADPAGLTLASARGQASPMQGWSSTAYGSKRPAWALEFARHASTADFATLLAGDGYAAQASTVTQTPAAGGATQLDVCVGATVGYRVVVGAGETPVVVTGGACAAPAPAIVPDPARAAFPAPALTLSAEDEAAFTPLPGRSGAIPVLLFHGITTMTGDYNTTAAEFARMMLMLRRAGYETIGIDDYARFMQGEPVALPTRPILVTFDDGRLDAYRGADATLAALGQRATIFDIALATETRNPSDLRWDELRTLQQSGRWDVQLHAGMGHNTVTVGADAAGLPIVKPYYAWRHYDPVAYPGGDHLESYDAWRTRAEDDIDQGDALLAAHLPGYRRVAFALPYGDFGQFHSNDARIAAELATHLDGRYRAWFTQPVLDPDFSTPSTRPFRYTVRGSTRAPDLYAWLKERAGPA